MKKLEEILRVWGEATNLTVGELLGRRQRIVEAKDLLQVMLSLLEPTLYLSEISKYTGRTHSDMIKLWDSIVFRYYYYSEYRDKLLLIVNDLLRRGVYMGHTNLQMLERTTVIGRVINNKLAFSCRGGKLYWIEL